MQPFIPTDVIVYHIIPYMPFGMLYVSKHINKICKNIINEDKLLDFSDNTWNHFSEPRCLYEYKHIGTDRLIYKTVLAFRYGDVTNGIRMFHILNEILQPSWFDILSFSSYISNGFLDETYLNYRQRCMLTSISPEVVYSHLRSISCRPHKKNRLGDANSRVSVYVLMELAKLERTNIIFLDDDYACELQYHIKSENIKYLLPIVKLFDIEGKPLNTDKKYKFSTLDVLRKKYTKMIANRDHMNEDMMKLGLDLFPNENWITYWSKLGAIGKAWYNFPIYPELYSKLYKVAPFTSYLQVWGFPDNQKDCDSILTILHSLNEELFRNEFIHLFRIPELRSLLVSRKYINKLKGLCKNGVVDVVCTLTLKELEGLYGTLAETLNITDEIIEEIRLRSPSNAQYLYDSIHPDMSIGSMFD